VKFLAFRSSHTQHCVVPVLLLYVQALGPQVVRTLLVPHLEPFMSTVHNQTTLCVSLAAAAAAGVHRRWDLRLCVRC
jgi:hypothetical protein